MNDRFLAALLTVIAVVLLVPLPAIGQASSSGSQTKTWEQPRTPWGDPDLQGIWNNVTATPLERPEELKGKALLTEEEAAEYERKIALQRAASESANVDAPEGARLGYSARVWFETGHALAEKRTSLVVDPPDWRLPALTPEARKRTDELAAAAKVSPADGPESRSQYERCITRGLPGAMMPGFYNHNYQIFQVPGYVVILVEMIHDARIIPLDGRPHIDSDISQWLGDSRGRWEGNTLVVETTNLSAVESRNIAVFGTSKRGRVVERFTRINAYTMDYQFTIEDRATFTQPWTASIPMTKVEGPIYEYACHEGNYGLPNILSGHRKQEVAESK